LQRAAAEAVAEGLKHVDAQLARRYERWRKQGQAAPAAQVALVAIDPRTGEIKALVGGRDYGQSQLNRALARRQPGSVFKPFVYAAAFASSLDGGPVLTPVTEVLDEPTTFYFGEIEYTPNNYGQKFLGNVELREALVHSLNVATVKTAELAGYDRVARFARQMGLPATIQPTPAVALGAYEMSPLEVAAGYTVFATGGNRAEPYFLKSVRAADGYTIAGARTPRVVPVLDPAVAYLVTNILEDVINRGTGAGVRARGFTAPAAGKTGTSHDGWFAGFTSNLLCVVWVGFDDNRELGLSGASSAAPIWAEFMKRAVALPAYRETEPFVRPDGVVSAPIDPETGQLATSNCPGAREEFFLAGTDPHEFCYLHGGRMVTRVPPVSWFTRLFGAKEPSPPDSGAGAGAKNPSGVAEPAPAAVEAGAAPRPRDASANAGTRQANRSSVQAASKKPAVRKPETAKPAEEEKKKTLLQRLFGIFGGGKKEQKEPERPPEGSRKPRAEQGKSP